MSRTTEAFKEWITDVRATVDLTLADPKDASRDRYKDLDTDWLWMAFQAGQQRLSGRISKTNELGRQVRTMTIELESLRSFKERVMLAVE